MADQPSPSQFFNARNQTPLALSGLITGIAVLFYTRFGVPKEWIAGPLCLLGGFLVIPDEGPRWKRFGAGVFNSLHLFVLVLGLNTSGNLVEETVSPATPPARTTTTTASTTTTTSGAPGTTTPGSTTTTTTTRPRRLFDPFFKS